MTRFFAAQVGAIAIVLGSAPVQRANPCGAGLSSSFKIRLSVAFV